MAAAVVTAPAASAATASSCPTTAGALCVQAARDSIAPAPAPRKFDKPATYKWLLNLDTTGTSKLLADGKTPDPAQTALCSPKTPTNPTGDPNNDYPAQCPWPSVHQLTSSPVVSQGTQADWNGTPLPIAPTADTPSSDANRGLQWSAAAPTNYLVSVTSNGYQIGGAHFSIDTTGHYTGPVIVSLNPWPIPLATVKLKVFADMAAANGQWDEQTEPGLAGFIGNLTDFDGKVSVDYYGHPLCTAYQADANGQIKLGVDGKPMVDPNRHWSGTTIVPGPSTGHCVSDANGEIIIPNMAANRYGASVIAPAGTATIVAGLAGLPLGGPTITIANVDSAGGLSPAGGTFKIETQNNGVQLVTCTATTLTTMTGCTGGTGTALPGAQVSPLTVCPVADTAPGAPCWVQTTTLEGNHDFDAWPMGNGTGVDTELVAAGEPVPAVQFGFALAGCLADSTKSIDPANYKSTVACANKFPLPAPPAAPAPAPPTPVGVIKGRIMGANSYFPGFGGLPGTLGVVGVAGYKFERPVKHGWVAISDLSNNDKTVYTAPANADGTFSVSGVPDGSYSVAVWDQPQDYIFDSMNVDVVGGNVVDLGVMPLLPWFTRINGHVCIDTNGNGRCDPGEPGVPNFTVQNLNRTNNTYEQGQNLSKTDTSGYYEFTEGYPLGSMNVIQAFNTRWKTTGVTWQACNDNQEHTYPTPAVDVSYQPIISQCGRLDWAVQPYNPSAGDNGGIVATVLYESVRNRQLARAQVQYDHFVGIPGVMTELFTPLLGSAAPAGTPTAANGYALNPDGSYMTTGPTGGYTPADRTPNAPTNAYQTEHYGRPTGCVAQDANGNVIQGPKSTATTGTSVGMVAGTLTNGQTVTDFLPGTTTDPASPNPGHYTQACLETPATGVAFGMGTDNLPVDPTLPVCAPLAGGGYAAACPLHGVQTVDGNYALAGPSAGTYLAKADIPLDTVLPQISGGDRPLYKVMTEASLNNWEAPGGGLDPYSSTLPATTVPQFIPQGANLAQVFDGTGTAISGAKLDWPPRAGKPYQMPVATPTPGAESPSTYVENPGTYSPAPDSQCAGPKFTVAVTDPRFQEQGGTPLQGLSRNLCDTHLLHVAAGQSVAPNYYLYTDVPIPTMFQVQNFDDTNLSTTKKQTQFGDAAPIPNSAEGVYDWAGNLVDRTHTDPNGIAEVLLPSSDVANCTTPAGICQNTYRFVGNDPGTPDNPNPNWDPQMQTITANFQALPGVFTPADTAPTRSAVQFLNSGQKFSGAAQCTSSQIAATGVAGSGQVFSAPALLSVDKPYTRGAASGSVTIKGVGFNATQGSGVVQLIGGVLGTQTLPTTSWTNTEIHATVGPGVLGGAYQLVVRNSNPANNTTLNGITYRVIRGLYTPEVIEVRPGAPGPTNAQWNTARLFPSIQEAVDRAAGYQFVQGAAAPDGTIPLSYTQQPGKQLLDAVVVVYPNNPTGFFPLGTWFEPIILHSAVHVQGVGPGGVQPAAAFGPGGKDTAVQGTVLDNRYYFAFLDNTVTPPTQLVANATQDQIAQHGIDIWQTVATALYPKTPAPDNQILTEGQVVTVLAQNNQPAYVSSAHPQVDGLNITGGIAENAPTNMNQFTGVKTGPAPTPTVTQGGAIFLNGHADYTQITNNVVEGNQGAYGAIRIGTPQLQGQHNYHVEIGSNQIIANGGNNLAGGLGIFNDSGGYKVHDNVFCGNQSAEYGGAMSQYGLSQIAPVAAANLTGTGTLNHAVLLLVGSTSVTLTTAQTGGAVFAQSDVGNTLTGTQGTAPNLRGTIRSVTQGGHRVTLDACSYSWPGRGCVLAGVGNGSLNITNESFTVLRPPPPLNPADVNSIDHNKIMLNHAIDEGGGIMIAGQLPANSTQPSAGTGPVNITNNTIAVNLSNDDGGGIRFLQAGNSPMLVANNMITNNVSSHEGGGISLDDAPQVTIISNTIAKNITTATAATSNGTAAPAGISTARNSNQLQATLPPGSPVFSDPVVADNVLWDNRAGTWSPSKGVQGIGAPGDTAGINVWDIGSIDNVGKMTPVGSLLSTAANAANNEGYNNPNGASNTVVVPNPPGSAPAATVPRFVNAFDLQLDIQPLRINFRFRPSAIVNVSLPANGIGDYHITTGSAAQRIGVQAVQYGAVNQPVAGAVQPPFPANTPIRPPATDIDGQSRPPACGLGFRNIDAGADQITGFTGLLCL